MSSLPRYAVVHLSQKSSTCSDELDVRVISGIKSRFGQWRYEYYVFFLLLSSLFVVIVHYALHYLRVICNRLYPTGDIEA